MQANPFLRSVCSGFLAAGILLSALLPAAAAGITEEPTPQETVFTEATVPATDPAPEATVSTQPSETVPLTEPAEEVPIPVFADEEPAYAFSSEYNLYFGLLHAHTSISDGLGSVEEAFELASNLEGLDFFAVTDHSNSFDNAGSGAIALDGRTVSEEWAAGKAAAAAVTDGDFLGIFGYEMTWPEIRQLGHITTFGTPGWISRDQEGFAEDAEALEHYFDVLATVPGSVSQFCHPGSQYGDFDRFSLYRPEYDASVQLVETLGEGSIASYILALDQSWHLAPTASQNIHNGSWGRDQDLRTVVLAEALTEKSLFEAICARRVYAAEDRDLHLSYELDGHIMGSVLSRADKPEIFLSVFDPSDPGGCIVEVIGPGGAILKTVTMPENGEISFRVPGGHRWYALKITQADADVAVTAPVWVEGFENMGIAAFTADTEIPILGQPLTLTLELFNEESVDFLLSSLEVFAGDTLIHRAADPGTLRAEETLRYSVSYTHADAGTVDLRVSVRGSVLGRERSYEEVLTLRFRPGETAAQLLIDGSHGNAGLDSLEHLKDLAREAGMKTSVFTGPMPLGGELLLIPPLQNAPEESFSEDVGVFLENGGSLLLLGSGGDNRAGNALLDSLGSTLRFGSEPVAEGSSTVFNAEAPWCAELSRNQFFRHGQGCALEPGSGQWLVKNAEDHILLAWERASGGGAIFAAGSPFLTDAQMPMPQSLWDIPRANQTIFQTILGTARPVLEQQPVGQVRKLPEGTLCRIKGYVTAGTSDPGTTFPDTIYLQDDTGGIAVTGFRVPDILVGMPLEVMGVLQTENGNPTLTYTDHQLPGEAYHYYTPETLGCKTATDYALRGGQLVQVEGTVTALTLTADKKGVCRLAVKDIRGDTAVIEIEAGIRSGSTGKNTLAKTVRKGRAVRVIGLLHRNEAGETVIRVRDCDEVVYIPPAADPTNPKTEDPLRWFR